MCCVRIPALLLSTGSQPWARCLLTLPPQSSYLRETGLQKGVFRLERSNGLTDWVRWVVAVWLRGLLRTIEIISVWIWITVNCPTRTEPHWPVVQLNSHRVTDDWRWPETFVKRVVTPSISTWDPSSSGSRRPSAHGCIVSDKISINTSFQSVPTESKPFLLTFSVRPTPRITHMPRASASSHSSSF